MRDYSHIDEYLNELEQDVYPQPQDAGHTALALSSIKWLIESLPTGSSCKTVLDVGAGEGFCQNMFLAAGISYAGISLGQDYEVAKVQGLNVQPYDFNFIPLENAIVDLVYSRHSLEHSFSPLISLLEWRRVSKQYLAIILPAPEHYKPGGRNHPYVLFVEQWLAMFTIAGWAVIESRMETGIDGNIWEYWFLLEKTDRPTYE